MVRFVAFLAGLLVLAILASPANASNGLPAKNGESRLYLPPEPGASPEAGLPPDGASHLLAPRGEMWFQFFYSGNRTPVEIRLVDGRAPDIRFAVYTPAQMEQHHHGGPLTPIGQMTRASGAPPVELHWVGKFSHRGVYFVRVTNFSDMTHSIGLLALGTAVQFTSRVVETKTEPQATVSDARDLAPLSTELPVAPLPPALVVDAVQVELPAYVGVGAFSIPLTARPARCTPAGAMPANVTRSVLLCPNQMYAPFRVTGSNLSVYGDPTALIRGAPRGYGITVTGNHVTVIGVRIAASTHPADINKWLCLYEECSYDTIYQKETVHGGAAYGGGILLLNNSNSAVVFSHVWGGTVGVASLRSHNNRIVNNNLSNLNGWGVYLMFADHNYVVNNKFDDVNRGCVGPDGVFYQSGCESAGFACAGCQNSVIVANRCARAGNCYYADGSGGLPSNDNKFFNNRCAAGNNCFEITFTKGNQFDYNVATFDAATGQQCNYPFWIGGSVVYFGRHNDWACTRQYKRAEQESKNSTGEHTEIRGL